MHSNSNLEIRIVGSFGHQQLYEHIILQITCTSKSGAFRLPDFSADSDSAGLSMEFSFGDSGTRVTLSLRKRESFASDWELSSTVSSGASSVLGSEFSVPGKEFQVVD